ncbi:HK97 gp10 family phage protein [Sphaerisporangium sp. TRM90804]|uniref:HK97 gp10 family phage protein n=1 Tax=Sphaerisporangium sp. TRM90804 TaxID=3031113 RepID=UPI002447684D|nr:HK97 gp10 family phage protein [Sphaerisporangium sp. TRM90804]MDH2429318.1 HK97 gp10 family phage protein [Sphaerisporangium sp. TRM90804]
MAQPRTGTDDLRSLIRSLGKLPDDMRKELRPVLRKAGQEALTQARANASWSTRIPKATKLSVSFAKRRPGIALTVNAARAPHARALENLGAPGFFRHPLFGNRRRWVRQKTRPFLWPAARAQLSQVDSDIAAAVDVAARKHGFK